MSSHRRRPKEITDIDRFIEQMTAMHGTVNEYNRNLRTDGEHYRAMRDLHAAIVETVRRVTGKEVPWNPMPSMIGQEPMASLDTKTGKPVVANPLR
jgi:hypothetical protein